MNKKPKVLLVGMGGTITMVPNEEGALAPAKSAEDLNREVPSLGKMAEIAIVQIVNLDSTNVSPQHWKELYGYLEPLCRNDYHDYNAIVVAHGTDTMAYTASAIALVLGPELKIPIVFTGSQLPMGSFGTDARFNLENSFKVIEQAHKDGIAEVMIVFNDKVLRASRTIKKSEVKFDAFESPAFPPLAIIDANRIKFIAEARRADKNRGSTEIKKQVKFNKSVLALDLVPGLSPDALKTILSSGCFDGVILKSFGAGNVPDGLIPVIAEAVSRRFPIVVATKFVGGNTLMGIYEVGKKALDAGAIPAGDMTESMTYVKLMWALEQDCKTLDRLKKLISTSFVGEITEQDNS